MIKKLTFIALTVLLSVEGLFAQQALFSGGPQITSPQVNPDNSVTFRLLAPDAREVRLTGDFIPAQGWMPGSELMTKEYGNIPQNLWILICTAMLLRLTDYA